MEKHDCITKLRANLMAEDSTIKYVRVDCSTIKTMSKGEYQDEKTGQRIWIGYADTKKYGTKADKEQKTFVTHLFCPFCGHKYR